MGKSDFTGMRKVTIKDTSTGGTGTFTVQDPENVGSDGFKATLETNEVKDSSFAGDSTSPNGTNTSAATIQLIPRTVADLAKIFPAGYDETTGTWQPPIGGCTVDDVTFVFEKVCDSKGNIILRHAQIGLGAEFSLSRDDTFMIEVKVYPTLSTGTEYGLAGDFASQLFPFQIYNGIYDPSTDAIDFDAVES